MSWQKPRLRKQHHVAALWRISSVTLRPYAHVPDAAMSEASTALAALRDPLVTHRRDLVTRAGATQRLAW
jgi:hypothetical protein